MQHFTNFQQQKSLEKSAVKWNKVINRGCTALEMCYNTTVWNRCCFCTTVYN